VRRELLRVTNAFDELGVPSRPQVDPSDVEARFRERAAREHPDRNGGDPSALARLNEARKTLSSDASRLRHLLKITFPGFSPEARFSQDFEMFSLVGGLVRSVEALAAKRDQTTSSIAAALLQQESGTLKTSLKAADKILAARRDNLADEIRSLDARWPDVTASELARLSENATFCEKWSESLRQAGVRLLGG
jgi:curved DNA-binding protein CbpA